MRSLFIVLFVHIVQSGFTQVRDPGVKWQKCFGGTGADIAYSITQSRDGNFVIIGETDSKDGDVADTTTSTNVWVIKINTKGELLWQRSYGGSGIDRGWTVTATEDSGFVFAAQTTSNNGDVSGQHGEEDIWVVKADIDGKIEWQRCYGGTGADDPKVIRTTSDGGYILIGFTRSSNGDVTDAKGGGDTWVVKIDPLGNIQWKKCFGNASLNIGEDVRQLPGGDFIISVTSVGLGGDFPGNSDLVNFHRYLARLDANGNIVSKHLFYSGARDQSAVYPIDDNELLVIGQKDNCPAPNTTIVLQATNAKINGSQWDLTHPATFGTCPDYGHQNWVGGNFITTNGSGLYYVSGSGITFSREANRLTRKGFIGQFSPDGAEINTRQNYFGGSGGDMLHSLVSTGDGDLIAVGFTNSNDGDVVGNHRPGVSDMWVVKVGKVNTIKGTVYRDLNTNAIKDTNEPWVSNILVESKKEGDVKRSLSIGGAFLNDADTGTYVTRPFVNENYYVIVPASAQSVFTDYLGSDSISFALQPIPGKKDYAATLFARTPARPGFALQYEIGFVNAGTTPLVDRKLKLLLDNRLLFQSASVTPDLIAGDTLTWNIANLPIGESGNISVNLMAKEPPELEDGDTLISTVIIDSTGDLTPIDNYSVLNQVATAAYDPNDKQETHGGSLFSQEYAANKSLLYAIRFQNTGNDTAFKVVIRDTLSAKLDWASFQMVGSSHEYTVSIADGNKIAWTFNNILLPDSNVNEPSSHGYISFRIKPNTTLSIGDTIKNSSAIYFDFNPPVQTNTHITILRPEAPPTPVITGLLDNYCNTMSTTSAKVANLPSPGSGTEVVVKIDGNTIPVGADGSFSLDVGKMTPGTHSLQIQFSNSTASRAIETGFTITAAVNPDVDVLTNVSNITSLSTQVTITAQNKTGGGSAPLYTFARDRNFIDISQPESANNMWTFDPSILSIGENKIYVRMKTSAICVVRNTVVDSILLTRSAVTGIFDPDMPERVINIYPNPFNEFININGLISSKNYTIRLFDLQGKELVTRQVSGRASFTITRRHLPTGIYWLSIYDEKRKRLLGTIKVSRN